VNSLAAVLQVFTMTSQVTINGVQQSFTGNVFQISADIAVASGQPVTPPTSILEYFQELVTGDTSEYQLTVSSQDEVLAKLNSDISNALGDFIAGTIPTYTFGTSPPTAANPVTFSLTMAQAETALEDFINGGTFSESPSGNLNTLTITGTGGRRRGLYRQGG
jgi:hypothetical protein